MAVAVAVVGCGILFLVLGTQHGLRRYVEECKLLCFTRINSRSALLMRRLLPLLLLLGAGPPAPVLRLQGNWQSLAPPLRLDWTCFSLGQRRRLSLTSLAQRRVGLCSTATSPASHAITLARVEVSHRLAAGGITRERVPTHDGDILLVRNRHVSERRWFTIGIPQLLAHLSLSLSGLRGASSPRPHGEGCCCPASAFCDKVPRREGTAQIPRESRIRLPNVGKKVPP